MKILRYEVIKKESIGPQNGDQAPVLQAVMGDTRMNGPYDTDVSYVDPMYRRAVQLSEYNSKKTKNYGHQ
jgi:hypothetical protein